MNQAYILIRSNIHRKINYPKALRRLRAIGTVLAISSVYETTDRGNNTLENFYNGVAMLETELDVHSLNRALRIIENQLGHAHTEDSSAPLTIDLDLVLFNHDTIDDADLHIPDPQILLQPFIAKTLAEISPKYVHPIVRRTLAEIANGFGESSVGIRIEPSATANAKQIFHHNHHGEFAHA